VSTLPQRFTSLNVWKRHGRRAPNKPLLALMCLARVARGEDRLTSFALLRQPLHDLLKEFGPPGTKPHPEHPFWYMRNDGLWEVQEEAKVKESLEANRAKKSREKGKKVRLESPSPTLLKSLDANGGFNEDVYAELQKQPGLIHQIAARLLSSAFPESYHRELLDAVGMPAPEYLVATSDVTGRKRDPAFRALVLRAYGHRCAICGYDGRLGMVDLALEAAHVKWHAAGGPDDVDNGIVLCSFHHKVLDRGAVALDDQHRVLVSQEVCGSSGVEDLLLRYAGKPIRAPQASFNRPALENIQWQRREVFRAPARAM
jgi:putative restriction endonuclease